MDDSDQPLSRKCIDVLVKAETCPYGDCGKIFTSKWSMTRHMRTHTGEKPFKCAIEGCGKDFIENCALKRHQHTHNSGKLFECTMCGKKFKFKEYLDNHIQQHNPLVDGNPTMAFGNNNTIDMQRMIDESRAALVRFSLQHHQELSQYVEEIEWLKRALLECSEALQHAVTLLKNTQTDVRLSQCTGDEMEAQSALTSLSKVASEVINANMIPLVLLQAVAKFNSENIANICRPHSFVSSMILPPGMTAAMPVPMTSSAPVPSTADGYTHNSTDRSSTTTAVPQPVSVTVGASSLDPSVVSHSDIEDDVKQLNELRSSSKIAKLTHDSTKATVSPTLRATDADIASAGPGTSHGESNVGSLSSKPSFHPPPLNYYMHPGIGPATGFAMNGYGGVGSAGVGNSMNAPMNGAQGNGMNGYDYRNSMMNMPSGMPVVGTRVPQSLKRSYDSTNPNDTMYGSIGRPYTGLMPMSALAPNGYPSGFGNGMSNGSGAPMMGFGYYRDRGGHIGNTSHAPAPTANYGYGEAGGGTNSNVNSQTYRNFPNVPGR